MSNEYKCQMSIDVKWIKCQTSQISNESNVKRVKCQMITSVKWLQMSNDYKCQMSIDVKWV